MFHFMNGMPGMGGMGGGGGRPVDTKLYNLLRVSPTASDDEIKKSYRQLAKEYHPDKNSSHGEKFKEISAAYEVLSDPRKRQIYDAMGMEGIQGNHDHDGPDLGDLFGGMGGSGIFGHLFGGMGGGGMMGGGRRRPRKGEATVKPLLLTLEELYMGKTSKLQLTKKALCGSCNGLGGKPGAVKQCSRCRGSGRVFITQQIGPGMIQQMARRCDECRGEGETINEKDRCRQCKGAKTMEQQKQLEAVVQPGMRENQKIVFHSEGDQEPGMEPGDVILVVKTKPHDVFQRRGDDLIMQRQVSLNEALCGYSTIITHLDGRTLHMETKPGEVIHPESIRTVIGEGMPKPNSMGNRGHLYVVFEVVFPPSNFIISAGDEEAAAYKKLEKLLPARSTQPNLPQPPYGENVEEPSLFDYDPRRYEGRHAHGGQREAYQSESDSDDEMGGGGGPGHGGGVRCAQQ